MTFWYDEDREFEDSLGELDVLGVKLQRFPWFDTFEAKRLLVSEDPDSNYIVYVPLTYAKSDDNWLLNI